MFDREQPALGSVYQISGIEEQSRRVYSKRNLTSIETSYCYIFFANSEFPCCIALLSTGPAHYNPSILLDAALLAALHSIYSPLLQFLSDQTIDSSPFCSIMAFSRLQLSIVCTLLCWLYWISVPSNRTIIKQW